MLLVYYILAVILMAIASWHVFTQKNNIEYYNLLFLITALSLGTYFHIITQSAGKKKIIKGLVILDIVYYLVNKFVLKTMLTFDSIGFTLLTVSVVLMIFMYLHQLLANVSDEKLSMNFDFWFISSVVVYFLGAFVIFLTFRYLTYKSIAADLRAVNVLLTKVWGLQNIFLFLSSLITTAGVLWILSHRRSPSLL